MDWLYHILTVLLLLTSLWIAWQDFKSREVSVLSLIVLSLLQLARAGLFVPLGFLFSNALVSLVFLGIQALAVFLYFFFRNRMREEQVRFSDLIGEADIWMMLVLLFGFSSIAYVFFITASTIVALVVWVVLKASGKLKDERIPLAGVFCILYVAVIILTRFLPLPDLYYPLD
jgi:hypothetical protein